MSLPRRPLLYGWLALAALMMMAAGVGMAQQAPAKVLHVAAAADLQPVMPAFAAAYEHETGVKLEVSFGSSSTLATQIINGAPFDVFLGADFTFPEKVVAAGLAAGAAPEPYAQGTLVLWTRKDSGLAPLSMDKLTGANITRIAVADPDHAPYGRAAYAAMDWMKLTDKLKPKLVVAENVGQAAQFAQSGNAQVAFISLTLAKSAQLKDIGSYEPVPTVYPKIRQCAVVMKKSPMVDEGRRFVAWLLSEPVQDKLTIFGLEPVK